MVLRWVGSAVLEAERRFHRVKGHREMPQLIQALTRDLPRVVKPEKAA